MGTVTAVAARLTDEFTDRGVDGLLHARAAPTGAGHGLGAHAPHLNANPLLLAAPKGDAPTRATVGPPYGRASDGDRGEPPPVGRGLLVGPSDP